MVLKQARLTGLEAEKEVLIKITVKRLRPDLTLRHDTAHYVVVVTIAYENSRESLVQAEERKRESYDCLKDTLLNK